MDLHSLWISTAQRWFQRFRSGAEVIDDAPWSWRPIVENCDKIAELIEGDRHSSSRSIGQERYKPFEEDWIQKEARCMVATRLNAT